MTEGIKSLIKRYRDSGQRGTGIIEALLATAITGTIAVVFLMAIDGGMSRADDIEDRLTADSLVSNQIEDIKSLPYNADDYYPVTASAPAGFSIGIDVIDASPETLPGTLQEILVTVYCDGLPIVSVETIKVDR